MRGKLLEIKDLEHMEGKKVYVDCVGILWGETRQNYSQTYIVKMPQLIQPVSTVFIRIGSLHNIGFECNVYEWIDDNKILRGDQIRNLPHGTKIRFKDNFNKENINEGIINQTNENILGVNAVNGCIHWYFTSLGREEVKGWVIEPLKQETEEKPEEMTYMESEFKINPNAIYSIDYKTLQDTRSRIGFEGCKIHNLEGKIQTFAPNGIVAVETEIGLQIIHTRQIVQMLVIDGRKYNER